MKSCELCKSAAKIYCDSDQASLCWTCDRKVHSANFLVARHSRSLLCRLCQSPTPWTASGEKLGPSSVSICENCGVDATSDEDDDEYDGDEGSKNEYGDDIQVVPLSYTSPPAGSSSSSDDYSTGKRKREFVPETSSKDEEDGLSVRKNHRVSTPEFSEAIDGTGRTLYQFLPLNSESMGDKLKK